MFVLLFFFVMRFKWLTIVELTCHRSILVVANALLSSGDLANHGFECFRRVSNLNISLAFY